MSDLGKALEPFIKNVVSEHVAGMNIEDKIREQVEGIASTITNVLEIHLNGAEEGMVMSLTHKQFPTLLRVMAIQGKNVLLTGGAGLSKSTAVIQASKALQLGFQQMSFNNQTTKTDLIGFVDAHGNYNMSGFVDAFIHGKVFLGDEMDACSSNVFTLLNSALSNGIINLPNGEVAEVHENFRFVGTANTNLRGSKDGFTARNKLDAASIDRFIVIEWLLDEELEQKLTNNDAWLKIVRKCRATAERALDNVAVTPRSSYDGADLLKAGFSTDEVLRMTVLKALGTDAEEILLEGITERMKKDAEKEAGATTIDATTVEDVEEAETVEDDNEVEDAETIESEDSSTDVDDVMNPSNSEYEW